MLERGRAWVELYRLTVIAERRAEREIAERAARRQRMEQRMGSGGRR